jgi:MFS family permease
MPSRLRTLGAIGMNSAPPAGHTGDMDDTELRRARAATFTVFFLTGMVITAWATRIPAIQDRLDLSPAGLSLAVLGMEGGAIAGLPLGAWLVARRGSRVSLRLGFVAYPAGLIAVAAAPGLGTLTLALIAMAAANSVVDVAMNAQGAHLEHRTGRPELSRLHAGHPIGLVAGGLAGTAAASAHAPVGPHFAVVAAVGGLLGLLATRWVLHEPLRPRQPTFTRPHRRLLQLGIVAFFASLATGAAENWSAVHMTGERGASPGLAAAAVTAYAVALAAGRLAGDRVIAAHGRRTVVQHGALLAAGGATVALTAPTIPLAIMGWALLGLGLAAVTPAVIGAAPQLVDAPPATAIAAVTTISYLGSFTGPPLIGLLTEYSTLTLALGTMVAASLLTAALARLGLRPRSGTDSSTTS